MALTYHRPALAADNATLIYNAKERMKALGWTVPRSGDATNYSSSGDLITSGAAMAVTLAWFECIAPDGSWAFSFQRGSSNTVGRVKFTWGNGFSAGSPSATQVSATASAGDEYLFVGGGTDAAPTYGTVIAGTGGNENLVVVADNAAPYGFAWLANRTTGVNGLDMLFFLDPLITESVDALDTAPSCAYWIGSSILSGDNSVLSSTTNGPVSWIAKGLGGAIVKIPAQHYRDGSSTVIPRGLSRSSYDSYAELFPLSYARRAALPDPDGWKGTSTLFTWIGSLEATGTRFTDDDGGLWISGGDIAIRWDGAAMANDPSGGATANAHFRSLVIQGDPAIDPDPGPLTATGRAPTRTSGRRVRRARP